MSEKFSGEEFDSRPSPKEPASEAPSRPLKISRREAVKLAIMAAGGAVLENNLEKNLRQAENASVKVPVTPVKRKEKVSQPTKKETLEIKAGHAKIVNLSQEAKLIPAELSGSRQSLDKQNKMADLDHLVRLESESGMKAYLKYYRDHQGRIKENSKGFLVELPKGKHLRADPYLGAEGNFTYQAATGKGKKKRTLELKGRKYRRDYCAQWTAQFLQDLAQDYGKEFPEGPALVVSSAVRPNDVQADLRGRIQNKNASRRSVHPTGAAIDLNWGRLFKRKLDGTAIWQKDSQGNIRRDRHGNPFPEILQEELPLPQRRWVEGRLILLKKIGLIEPEQEGSQPCYHIMVPKAYGNLMEKHKKELYY
ncbi:MAG: DUF5715 family protein [Patescibacteria group bacterium]|nr:DUF5715 family protein [Patescibacteria group bacterium]